jgi:hypothetical protein
MHWNLQPPPLVFPHCNQAQYIAAAAATVVMFQECSSSMRGAIVAVVIAYSQMPLPLLLLLLLSL